MKLTSYIPAMLSICMILGITFGFYMKPESKWVIIGLIGSLLALTISFYFSNKSFKERTHFSFIGFFLFFIIGISTVSFQNSTSKKNHYSHYIKTNNKVVLSVEKQLKSNKYSHKYISNVSQINDNNVFGKILLNIKRDTLNNHFNVDDKIIVNSKFKQIYKPLNLYQFDYQNYLKKQQIYHQLSTGVDEVFIIDNRKITLNGLAARFREKINIALLKYDFSKNELAIINALLLGQRNHISKALFKSYAGAGAIHILAVSGLHIGILLLLLNGIFKPITYLKNGKIIKLIIIVILLWIYALIAGLSPSVIRAVTMFTAITIGLLSKKKTNTLHNLFISMFFLLLIHPLYIFSVGFQLSYLAVFSIVYFYPLFIRFYNPSQWFVKRVWQLIAISFSAQIGILPLSFYYFHQFPSLFFVSSLIIIPLLGFILGFGILVIGLALFGILPQFMADSFGFIIQKMNAFIFIISQQESFLIRNISFSISLVFASYLILVFGYRLWEQANSRKLIFGLLSVLLFQGILIYEKWQLKLGVELVIFNQSKKSIISVRSGSNSKVFHNLDTTQIIENRALSDYSLGLGGLEFSYKNHQNIVSLTNSKFLIIDSLAVYKNLNFKPDIILLRQSPKINLNRLIKLLNPKKIIADASNYKSYKVLWNKTCTENHVEFHDTSVSGAFVYR